MAWTNPATKSAGNTGLSSDWNTYVRDNTNALRDYLLGAQDLGSDFKFQAGRALRFSDPDVAHGITTIVPTDEWGGISEISGTAGGLLLRGLSDADAPALHLHGVVGSTTPANGALYLIAAKKNGTGLQDIGSSESAILFQNNSVFLGRFYGAGLNVVGGASVGYAGVPVSGALTVGDVTFAITNTGNPTLTFDTNDYMRYVRSTNVFEVAIGSTTVLGADSTGITTQGLAVYPSGGGGGSSKVSSAILMTERADPTAPAANDAYFYAKDNGSGKTQLVALFSSGAVQVIATQP